MECLYENETCCSPFFHVFREELGKMNESQRLAVLHDKGAALCLAGPGSGKTRVISLRAIRLLAENEAYKNEIVLTLAFNKPAGVEMKSRGETFCKKIWGDKSDSVLKKAKFATIHSYCYELVRLYLNRTGKILPKVIDEEESINFIEKSYLDVTGKKHITKDVLKRVKGFVLKESIQRNEADVNATQQLVLDRIGENYKEYKLKNNLIDFQDMQEMACNFLEKDEDFCNFVKSRFLYTQIDEAQDLSLSQLKIISLISRDNVFFVADDDQSIYGFRGAEPKILRMTEAYWSEVKKYLLDINYRSNSEIVDVSSWVIRGNLDRFKKNISSFKPNGANIKIKTFFSVNGESEFVSRKIVNSVLSGRTVAVLYRNNSSCIMGITKLFFYSKLFSDDEKIKFLPNVYGEGVTLGNMDYLKRLTNEIRIIENDTKRIFVPSIYGALKALESEQKLDLILLSGELAGRRPFFRETIKEVIKVIGKESDTPDSFVQNMKDIDSFRNVNKNSKNVVFSTIHSAKGLEFDDVIIMDCVKGEFPNGNVKRDDILMEERRLLYVAMTRAKENLYVLRPERCGKLYLTESMFIDEIRGSIDFKVKNTL